jgi:hypothetical protein
MKKTNKSNPLKTFNDNKAMAYKKAGGEMAAYKKSLIKAQDGIAVDSAYKASQMMEPNSRTNVDTVNQSIIDKIKSTSSAPNNPQMYYLQKYGEPKSPSMSKEMMDSMTNRPKSNTPMMDSMFQKKKGGSVKRKKK